MLYSSPGVMRTPTLSVEGLRQAVLATVEAAGMFQPTCTRTGSLASCCWRMRTSLPVGVRVGRLEFSGSMPNTACPGICSMTSGLKPQPTVASPSAHAVGTKSEKRLTLAVIIPSRTVTPRTTVQSPSGSPFSRIGRSPGRRNAGLNGILTVTSSENWVP